MVALDRFGKFAKGRLKERTVLFVIAHTTHEKLVCFFFREADKYVSMPILGHKEIVGDRTLGRTRK